MWYSYYLFYLYLCSRVLIIKIFSWVRTNRNGRISYGGDGLKRTTFRTAENINRTASRLARQANAVGNIRRAQQVREIASRWTSSREIAGSRPFLTIGGARTQEGTLATTLMTNAMRATNEDRAAAAAKGSING